MVNQIVLAPGLTQDELVGFCRKEEILVEAYSPLGTGGIFKNEVAKEVAAKNGKSVAQVALRWSLQHGFLPLPKSVTPANITSNLEIFDFDLSDEDVETLNHLEAVIEMTDPDAAGF